MESTSLSLALGKGLLHHASQEAGKLAEPLAEKVKIKGEVEVGSYVPYLFFTLHFILR